MSEAEPNEIDALLAELEEQERDISLRRRRLHDRIALFPGTTGDLDLTTREAELSRQRRELHRRIDELRTQRNALRTPDGE